MANAETLTILLKLTGSRVVVIGEDTLAEDWACYVAELGAEVHLIAPRPSETFPPASPRARKIHVVRRGFEDDDLRDCDLLIVLLQDFDACKSIARTAQQYRVSSAFPCSPGLGTIVIPRTYDFDFFQILLPRNSQDPPFNKTMSRDRGRSFSSDFSRALQLLNSFSNKVREHIEDTTHHSRVLNSLFDSSFPELILTGQWEDAEALSTKVILSYAQNQDRKQRFSPRVGVNLEVQFTAQDQPHSGRIFNLSRDGAFIATQNTFPKLTPITALRFTLPTKELICDAEGVVVWENSTVRPQAPIYPSGFALMFESLTPNNLTTIERYVLSQLK
ncbi:MAG: NAD(P)-dependent oxidoreductase [Terriglobia bacterium]